MTAFVRTVTRSSGPGPGKASQLIPDGHPSVQSVQSSVLRLIGYEPAGSTMLAQQLSPLHSVPVMPEQD